jgi:hypothetical protein
MTQSTFLLPRLKLPCLILGQDIHLSLLRLGKRSIQNLVFRNQERFSRSRVKVISFHRTLEIDRPGGFLRAEDHHVSEIPTVRGDLFAGWGFRFAVDAAGWEDGADCIGDY